MLPDATERVPALVDLASPFRRATPADSEAMADLVHFASEGLAFYLWSRMAGPGGDPWAVGRERARRPAGAFSYSNAILAERDGRVAAGLIGYPLADVPEPPPDNPPAMFVPLNELEELVPGTWYVNVLAAYPEHCGKGLGTALLSLAEELARQTLRRGMSIIVADTNVGARRLYERCGYREVASRRMVKEGWVHPGTSFVLLAKRLGVQGPGPKGRASEP
jgi:GNAT superfamily N-acetyltransferase